MKPRTARTRSGEVVTPGQTYGRWFIISIGSPDKYRAAQVVCACGEKRVVLIQSLVNGKSRSCGCLHREIMTSVRRTHGLTKHPSFKSWKSMIERCLHENSPNWQYYGGRGIKVCRRWLDVKNFIADTGERPKGTSLDRINNDGNYEPKNCRWATAREQMNNRRNTITITHAGRSLPIAEWSRLLGMAKGTLTNRYYRGWAPAEIVSTKNHKVVKRRVYAGS